MNLRRSVSQRAFTLIELLVVILVVAVLIAVAAPSFLGQQDKAHDSAAKQYLTVAYKAGKPSWRENDRYLPAGTTADAPGAETLIGQLKASEPQMRFRDADTELEARTPRSVRVLRAHRDAVTYMTQSASGRVYCLQSVERPIGAVSAGLYWSWGAGEFPCGGPDGDTGDVEGGTPTADGQPTTPTNPPDPSKPATDGEHPLPLPPDGPVVVSDPNPPEEPPTDPDQEPVGAPLVEECGPAPATTDYRALVTGREDFFELYDMDGTIDRTDPHMRLYGATANASEGEPGIVGTSVDLRKAGASSSVMMQMGLEVDHWPQTNPRYTRYDTSEEWANEDFTFETWVYFTDSHAASHIYGAPNGYALSGQRSSDYGPVLSVGTEGGSFGVYDPNLSGTTTSGRWGIPTRQWAHVAGTRDNSTGETRLYLNGKLVSEVISPSRGGGLNGFWYLGGRIGTSERLPARMDEAAIYRRVLTQAELCEHFRVGERNAERRYQRPSELTAAAAGTYEQVVSGDAPARWWRLDDAAGSAGAAAAAGGQPLNATPASGVQFGERSPLRSSTSAWLNGGKLQMYSAANPSTTTTAEIWVREGAGGGLSSTTKRPLFGHLSGNGNGWNWQLAVQNGRPSFQRANETEMVGRARIDDGKWHHLVGVRDGANLMLYVDGVLDSTRAEKRDIYFTDGYLMLSNERSNGDAVTNFKADEPAVYNRALSSQEIYEHYTAR